MENRYLCKAKRTANGEWVEGSLVPTGSESCIVSWDAKIYFVDLSTRCQCTGYEGIYEKDIFQCDDERYLIVWNDCSLSWEARSVYSSESVSLGEFDPKEIDVIGNEIDNPELLEV